MFLTINLMSLSDVKVLQIFLKLRIEKLIYYEYF
jgi:hypothetical protein